MAVTRDDITKKAIIYGVTDLLWQYGCQYPDRYLANERLASYHGLLNDNAEYMGSDLMATIYPFALAIVAWGLAKAAFYKDDEKKKDDVSFEVSRTVLMGIGGWTAGYYIADHFGWSFWQTAAAVGVGAATPGLLLTASYNVMCATSEPMPKRIVLLTAALTFVAGFAWLVASDAPNWIQGNAKEEQAMRAGVAPLMTFLSTALCAGLAMCADDAARKQKYMGKETSASPAPANTK